MFRATEVTNHEEQTMSDPSEALRKTCKEFGHRCSGDSGECIICHDPGAAPPTTPRRHEGYCYPDCGCPESAAFDWDRFAADINGDPT